MPNTGPDHLVNSVAAAGGASPSATSRRVHVAVGVISDGRGSILVAKRAADAHQGGLWEFPGGKVEPGETVQVALRRELAEELAIDITACEPLIAIQHDYSDKAVLLDVWWVSGFIGVPRGSEGQPISWTPIAKLRDLTFPVANQPIIAAIEQHWAGHSSD